MEFCLQRYSTTRHGISGIGLEAGCGSGGGLSRLAEHCDAAVGQDVDLPSMIIAAKRIHECGLAGKVSLVAAPLEQRVFPDDTFDIVKCTDVIEHVAVVDLSCQELVRVLKRRGALFMLTPNKWSFWSSEPHVRMWGVQFLPPAFADAYVRWRIGIPYRPIAHLLSYRRFVRALRAAGAVDVHFIPVEDKHLNPSSARGNRLKRIIATTPFRQASWLVRPLQPSLEALCIKQ
jgi:SAM-dependent methyltransferase